MSIYFSESVDCDFSNGVFHFNPFGITRFSPFSITVPSVPPGSPDSHVLIFVSSYAIYDITVHAQQSLYKAQRTADLVRVWCILVYGPGEVASL